VTEDRVTLRRALWTLDRYRTVEADREDREAEIDELIEEASQRVADLYAFRDAESKKFSRKADYFATLLRQYYEQEQSGKRARAVNMPGGVQLASRMSRQEFERDDAALMATLSRLPIGIRPPDLITQPEPKPVVNWQAMKGTLAVIGNAAYLPLNITMTSDGVFVNHSTGEVIEWTLTDEGEIVDAAGQVVHSDLAILEDGMVAMKIKAITPKERVREFAIKIPKPADDKT
jgi:hypothetical protein